MAQRLIYLARHGEVNNTGKKTFIGQIDLSLTAKGVAQAKRLQQELSCVQMSNIYSSDLKRSIETAEIIAKKQNAELNVCPELKEISLGEWEGKTFDEVVRRYPREFKKRGEDIVNYKLPGGESFAELRKRVIKKFNEITSKSKGNILIVGHSGMNRMILCYILEMPLENLFTICQDFCCLNIILQGNYGFKIRAINKVQSIIPK